MSPIRILIVDDFEDWRRQVLLLLQARPEWQVIAEASDGPETIQKAEKLKPDLIVLDIGLPKLNGIHAARRIRELSPSSKIVFLSQNNDRDIVGAALSTGALGYVIKTNAQRELVLAVDAVLRGKQFVSNSIEGYEFSDAQIEKTLHCHEVQFCSNDEVFLDSFARFIGVAIQAGDAAIVVATESHLNGLVPRLKIQGVDVDAAMQQGRYVQLDVSKTLSAFMVNDIPDPARFFEAVGGLIEAAAKTAKREHPRVVACGECAPFLLAEGKTDAAIRIERLWDEIGQIYEMDTLCGYALNSFHGEEDQHIFQSICAEHSAVYSQ